MHYKYQNLTVDLKSNNVRALSPVPHIHPHLELIFLKEGSTIVTVDGADFLLKQGEFFFAFPNQIHAYHDREPLNAYLLVFSIELFEELKELFSSMIPTSPIVSLNTAFTETEHRLSVINTLHCSENIFDRITSRGLLLSLLGELLNATTLIESPSDQDIVRQLLLYCLENYTAPLSLNDLANALHLSKFYVSHIFNQRLHMSFNDFINSLRLRHACTLLKKGRNITEIALSSGFSSVRTFNRVFAQQMKMTPREYINSSRKDFS